MVNQLFRGHKACSSPQFWTSWSAADLMADTILGGATMRFPKKSVYKPLQNPILVEGAYNLTMISMLYFGDRMTQVKVEKLPCGRVATETLQLWRTSVVVTTTWQLLQPHKCSCNNICYSGCSDVAYSLDDMEVRYEQFRSHHQVPSLGTFACLENKWFPVWAVSDQLKDWGVLGGVSASWILLNLGGNLQRKVGLRTSSTCLEYLAPRRLVAMRSSTSSTLKPWRTAPPLFAQAGYGSDVG